MTTKARSEDAKQARLGAILEAARRLSARRGFAAVTMAEIAREAGLAKGTLYLYCRTKEEVFLALGSEALEDWFGALRARLGGAGPLPLADFARGLAREAAARPELLRLATALHAGLESNAGAETLVPFRLWLCDRVAALGGALEARCGLAPGVGAAFLAQAWALVVGYAQIEAGDAAVHAARGGGDLALSAGGFETGLAAGLDRLCAGYTAQGDRPAG